jgi:predicted ATPase/DNA-binding winged helix-turn-helix (wHTH) protein
MRQLLGNGRVVKVVVGADESELSFGPFRVSQRESRLLRDGRPVALTPKAVEVLHFLASRPDRLVTKDELLSAVWPDVVVSDASVKVCVREIRKALADDADEPRFIETVHRKGYRFVAGVEGLHGPLMDVADDDATAREIAAPYDAAARADDAAAAERHRVVGRERELAQLGQVIDRARAGARQVVFITGGPGAGKTAFVEAFVRSAQESGSAAAAASPTTTIAVGHCFQQFGAGEPYLPVWEAIGRLAREGRSPRAAQLMAETDAPSDPSVGMLGRGPGAAREAGPTDRRLRQLADALESIAGDGRLLVLVLEDLHWADYSTLDLISTVARRRGPGRLLVLGTYRPAEVADGEHPLRAVTTDLLARRLAIELPMSNLDEPAVAQYLAQRLGGRALPAALVPRLHDRTGGNPLFLVSLIEDLIEQAVLREGSSADERPAPRNPEFDAHWVAALDGTIPRGVREMIVAQLDRLSDDEQRVLEAAAVSGVEFSAAAAAGALGDDVVAVEETCDDLAHRHRFLESRGPSDWPDGTLAHRFRFLHELFHDVVYSRVRAARGARMHQALGLRMEQAWGERVGDVAAELAVHFEQGRDWPRAMRYLRHAADAAMRQYAHGEAVDYLRRALAALNHLAEPERVEHELELLMSLGVNLQVTKGCAAPEVEDIRARAYLLCRAAPEGSPSLFPVLWGIWVFHKVRSELPRAKELAEQLLTMAQAARDDGMMLQAHQALSVTALCSGDPRSTVAHMKQAEAIYDVARHAANARSFGQDPGVACLAFGAVGAWLCGDEAAALDASRRAVEFARASDQPTSIALALHFAAILHQLRGDPAEVRRQAEASIVLAAEEGFSFWHAGSTVLRGWARVVLDDGGEEGLEEIRRGVADWLATGSRTYHTYYLGLLADALLTRGRADEALVIVNDAIEAAVTLEGLYEAELHRLKGCCLMKLPGEHSAEARRAFEQAVTIAHQQGATSLEARAARERDRADEGARTREVVPNRYNRTRAAKDPRATP